MDAQGQAAAANYVANIAADILFVPVLLPDIAQKLGDSIANILSMTVVEGRRRRLLEVSAVSAGAQEQVLAMTRTAMDNLCVASLRIVTADEAHPGSHAHAHITTDAFIASFRKSKLSSLNPEIVRLKDLLSINNNTVSFSIKV